MSDLTNEEKALAHRMFSNPAFVAEMLRQRFAQVQDDDARLQAAINNPNVKHIIAMLEGDKDETPNSAPCYICDRLVYMDNNTKTLMDSRPDITALCFPCSILTIEDEES